MIAQLLKIYNKVERAQSLAELNDLINQMRELLGFEYALYATQYPTSFTRAGIGILGNYPQAWLDQYSNQGYVKIDPVVQHCFSSLKPFCWESFSGYKGDSPVAKFYQQASAIGLCGGVSIGIKGCGGTAGLISLVTKVPLNSSSEKFKKSVFAINSLSPLLHEKIIEISTKDGFYAALPSLSQRERDCLTWVAEGKTSGEIATILSIVEPTVTYHLKNVIRKLTVTNRNQAIAKAVRLELIQPQFPATMKG